MSRIRMLSGASLPMLCGVLSSISSNTHAQAVPQTLPPVSVEAPQAVRPKPAVRHSRPRSASAARSARQPAAGSTAGASAQNRTVTASAARDGLNQAPAGVYCYDNRSKPV